MGTRPRGPGFTNAGLVLALLVLIATFALTQRQPPPPSIAEFAPQAVEHITDSPGDQSSRRGAGAGLPTPASDAIDGVGATPPPIDVPRVRRCVGDPPRQIEDPQSPPCVPYWSGDNGGATALGVSRDDIRVIVANGDSNTGPRVNTALLAFFNRRFEFYGRKIINVPGVGGPDTCEGHKAQAHGFREQSRAFAFVGTLGGNMLACLTYETARQGVIDIHNAGDTTEVMDEVHPFMWRYASPHDETMRVLGSWACASLAGRPARWAPEPRYRLNTRKFGLIVQRETSPYAFKTSWLTDRMARCGEKLVVADVPIDKSQGQDAGLGQFTVESNNAVLRMKTADVSTTFCICPVFTAQIISGAASNQAYYPEWVFNDWMTPNWAVRAFWPNSDQRVAVMALSGYKAHLPYAVEPMNVALAETDNFRVTNSFDFNNSDQVYVSLLVLASGIQMAGPRLTPSTFASGLKKTKFPNPRSTLALGRVGFEDGRHTFIRDYTPMYWSDTGVPPRPDEAAGAYCYPYGSQRFAEDKWPPGEPAMFGLPCDAFPPGASFP